MFYEEDTYKIGCVYASRDAFINEISEDIKEKVKQVSSASEYKIYLLKNETNGLFIAYSNLVPGDPCWVIEKFNEFENKNQYDITYYNSRIKLLRIKVYTEPNSNNYLDISFVGDEEILSQLNKLVNNHIYGKIDISLRIDSLFIEQNDIRHIKETIKANTSYSILIYCLDWKGNSGSEVTISVDHAKFKYNESDVNEENSLISNVEIIIPACSTRNVVHI